MSWKNYKLEDVCTVTAGQSPEGKHYNKDGKGAPFYQGKKLFSDKYLLEPNVWTLKTTKLAKPGDILMSVRAPVGSINISKQEICIGTFYEEENISISEFLSSDASALDKFIEKKLADHGHGLEEKNKVNVDINPKKDTIINKGQGALIIK